MSDYGYGRTIHGSTHQLGNLSAPAPQASSEFRSPTLSRFERKPHKLGFIPMSDRDLSPGDVDPPAFVVERDPAANPKPGDLLRVVHAGSNQPNWRQRHFPWLFKFEPEEEGLEYRRVTAVGATTVSFIGTPGDDTYYVTWRDQWAKWAANAEVVLRGGNA